VNAAGNVEVCETVTAKGEVYALVTEFADPNAQQELALEIFCRAALTDLRAHLVERLAA
jgi:hypothetical protein